MPTFDCYGQCFDNIRLCEYKDDNQKYVYKNDWQNIIKNTDKIKRPETISGRSSA
jgi:hypothetical protein